MKENIFTLDGARVSPPFHSQTGPSHHILVVEEDISIRQLNTEVLSGAGYEVDAAEDGASAWEALRADSYDLLITANNMSKVSGVELLKKLRAARMALPVIMATTAWPNQEFTRYPWLKPAAMLLKPYTVGEMLRTVKKVLRERNSPTDGAQLLMFPGMTLNQRARAGAPAGAARPYATNSPPPHPRAG